MSLTNHEILDALYVEIEKTQEELLVKLTAASNSEVRQQLIKRIVHLQLSKEHIRKL